MQTTDIIRQSHQSNPVGEVQYCSAAGSLSYMQPDLPISLDKQKPPQDAGAALTQ